MTEKTAEEWGTIFDEKGVWYAPIVSFDQVATDEQALATGAIAPPTAGVPWALVGSPIQFSVRITIYSLVYVRHKNSIREHYVD